MNKTSIATVLIVLCLAIFCARPGYAVPQATDEQIIDVSSPRLQFDILREIAIDGNPEVGLHAFLHVYNNLPELEDKLPEALAFLSASAKAGNTEAQYMLGYVQVRENIVQAPLDEGLSWLGEAAKSGHEQAFFWLGVTHLELYFKASSDSELEVHFVQAERWLRRCITDCQKLPNMSLAAQVRLGRLYLARSMSDQEGWKMLMEAADRNYEPAISTLLKMERFLKRQLNEGYSEAAPLLEQVTKYLESSKRQ